MDTKKTEKIEILTIILMSMSIFIYEICYCNFIAIAENTYNFSLFRIVMYIVFIVLYKMFSNKFINEVAQTLQSKKKILIAYIIISIFLTIYFFSSNMNTYYIFIGLISEINGLLFLLYITKDYIKNIIITTITLGFVFALTTTAYHEVDEKKHFMSALNVADGNFDFKNPITEEIFNNIEFTTYMRDFAMKYFNQKYSKNIVQMAKDESIFSTPADYNPISYIPSALGINVARILKGSVADIFIAGRIANLITFSILLIITFKLLPFKKDIFYVIYLMPLAIILAATYTADTLTIGLVGIFIAYVLKLYKENYDSINLKQFLILAALFAISLICKGGSYLGICLIVFILPIFKIIKNNKKILYATLTIMFLACTIGMYKYGKITKNTSGDQRVEESNPKAQIQYLLENPSNIIKVYCNYIKESLVNLSWYKNLNLKLFTGNAYELVSFLLLILIIYTAITDSSYTFKKKEKNIMYFTFGIILFMTTFILYLAYTKVGDKTIGGYQTRYIIPIMPLILINANSKFISKEIKDSDANLVEYNRYALFIGILTYINLIARITV